MSSLRRSIDSKGHSSQRSREFSARSAYWNKTEEMQPLNPPPLRGELLTEIMREDILKAIHDTKIKDCSYVASYTWLNVGTATMLIPGKPPAWTPPTTNRRLEPDKGKFFRDQNAARYPTYPMEPAVQAMLKLHPEFPTKDIDIFTCTSALGNLVRFVRGVEKEFRIILARVGNTVFFIRRENSPTELIPNVRGYGHTFPDEYTSWEKDVKSSECHQRLIQYSFGGLRFLVRFGVDGYFPKGSKTSEPPLEARSLIRSFAGASVSHDVATGQKCLHIKEGGRSVPQKDIFDIKTRSAFDFKTRTVKKEIDLTDILPRLWISQISYLIVGFHDRGLFEDIRVRDMRTEIAKWEEENAENLHKFASLLRELVDFAKSSKTNLEICHSGAGPLEIRRLAGEGIDALPPKMTASWVGGQEDNDDGSLHHGDFPISGIERARDSDEESIKDYTACSLEGCGYCGQCRY